MAKRIRRIDQFSPSCTAGDGVTNGLFFTRSLLRELGFESEIFCDMIAAGLESEVRPASSMPNDAHGALFYHHSLGYDEAQFLTRRSGPLVIYYHNITPEEMLPLEGPLRRLSRLGRQQLGQWAPLFNGALAASTYSAEELAQHGYRNARVLPLLVDTGRFAKRELDPARLESLRDAFNILFVGRFCENKGQLDLVDAFEAFTHYADAPSRLILVGGTTDHAYRERVVARVRELGLEGSVLFTGKLEQPQLEACYGAANVYLCLSRHEGFGMPLIEAMAHDVPVIGLASTAVGETIGDGGILLEYVDPDEVAATIQLVASSPDVRRRVRTAQRARLGELAPQRLARELAEFLASLDIEIPRMPSARPPLERKSWRVEGPFDSSYSLAVVNRNLALALSRDRDAVGLHSTEGAGDFAPDDRFLEANPEVAALVAAARMEPLPDVTLRYCHPPRTDAMNGVLKVVASYGWEETGFPADYAEWFNRNLDAVTVLSCFVRTVLRNAGVRVPIGVVGAGTDHITRVASRAPDADIGRGFRFLHVSSCFPRKGVDALLAAYGRAFVAADPVTLVIKTFSNRHNTVASQLSALRSSRADFPNVVLIENPDWDDARMRGLYEACDAFVAASRGEGLGLPVIEAMLLGLPVVTTAWSGLADFCNEDNAWICRHRLDLSGSHVATPGSMWAEPDVDDLARQMRAVWSASPAQRAARLAAAGEMARSRYTWAATASRTRDFCNRVEHLGAPREPKIGWLSTWNDRCGIASYSMQLTCAIPRDRLVVFANHIEQPVAADAETVRRCWRIQGDGGFDELRKAFDRAAVQILVIQYNFGFFSLATLARIVAHAKTRGCQVHLFLHSTQDVDKPEMKASLGTVAEALRSTDRVFVHTAADIARLQQWIDLDNVVLFPHGVYEAASKDTASLRTKYGFEKGRPLVACFGFLLPHKGIPELIEAFAQVARRDRDAHLLLLNARYPVPASARLEQECRDRISEFGLERRITLVTDFLDDATVLDKLRRADLVVFPYQETQESSSAAVRMGLAVGRPVAVTPLPIFDEVGGATARLPGTGIQDIADGLTRLLGDPDGLDILASKAHDWAQDKRWPVLSVRLLNLIDGLDLDHTMRTDGLVDA